jgi:hypothetical protein
MRLFLIGGPSAIGKNTFIERLAIDESIRSRLQIPSDAKYLTARKGDEVYRCVSDGLKAAYATEPSATVVAKWQASMDDLFLHGILNAYPDTEIRGVFLWLDEQKHRERFLRKHLWGYAGPDEERATRKLRGDRAKNRSRFMKLAIETVVVDAESCELLDVGLSSAAL